MFPALSSRARMTAALIAVLALASVAGQFVDANTVRNETYAETALEMARFFTILSNLLVTLTWGLVAIRREGLYPPWLAALTMTMIMVGSVYHLLLSHLVTFTGLGLWSDHGLHTAVPIACLLWWLVYAPKRSLVYADLPAFAVWPAVYVAYALWRGSRDGTYPYPFMDLTTLSAAAVAVNLAGLTTALLLGGVVFISIGRFADR